MATEYDVGIKITSDASEAQKDLASTVKEVKKLGASASSVEELAKSLDLELTEWHFEVLNAVRQFYQQFGHSPATRPLIKFLMKTVSPEINNAELQQKFNTGLVARHLSRLAGVPKPANCL